ncbi:MAG: hypothetical protein REJ23_05550 [Brevundimonas sp.]|nr:hypothetical protein [Brevundimonas sp.]
MSYGADFATADPANAPLDAPIYFGADPVLWGALILGLLAAALLGWVLRGQSAPKGGDASASIWKAIDGAAKDAMKADDNALHGRAEHLLTVIDRRLGHTLALAGNGEGLAACVAALNDAVAGKRPDPHDDHKDDADHAHRPGKDHDHTPGEHADKGPDHAHGPTSSVGAAAANITINVAPSAPAKPEKPDGGGHPPHPPRPKPLTRREQIDQLRLAVAAFNEHWRHEGARTDALRAALRELSGGPGGVGGPRLSHG